MFNGMLHGIDVRTLQWHFEKRYQHSFRFLKSLEMRTLYIVQRNTLMAAKKTQLTQVHLPPLAAVLAAAPPCLRQRTATGSLAPAGLAGHPVAGPFEACVAATSCISAPFVQSSKCGCV